MKTAYLDGVFLPLDEVKISPLDRGFLFGDGVYEVIPVYNGQGFCDKAHLKRLQQSLDGIELSNPLSDEQWQAIFSQLITANGPRQLIYLQVTRGVQTHRGHTFDEKQITPTLFAMSMPFHEPNHDGLSAIITDDTRWFDCYIKSTNLLPNVLQLRHAHANNANEVIMLREGFVTEAAASNVFIVKNNIVQTPPDNPNILPGITKQFILKLARQNKIAAEEVMLSERMLLAADEIWLSSSSKEIAPVIKLNGEPVGLGKPGPIWQTMQNFYQKNTPK